MNHSSAIVVLVVFVATCCCASIQPTAHCTVYMQQDALDHAGCGVSQLSPCRTVSFSVSVAQSLEAQCRSSGGVTISIARGTTPYSGPMNVGIKINASAFKSSVLTLKGRTGSPSGVIFDGHGVSFIFNVTGGNVAIDSVTMQNGWATNNGGCVSAMPSSQFLSVTNSLLISCYASRSSGGGIYIGAPSFHIEQVTVHRCTSSHSGGGVFISNASGGGSITNSTFSSNVANGTLITGGGGVHAVGSVGFETCIFENNIAQSWPTSATPARGGGLLGVNLNAKFGHGKPTLNKDQFQGNSADFGGAVALLSSGGIRASHVRVVNNQAQTGAGMYLWADKFYVDDVIHLEFCTVQTNRARGNGGGVYVGPFTGLESQNTTFSENIAQAAGGAVALNDSTVFFVDGSVFRGNRAASRGGGVSCSGKSIRQDSVNVSNSAFQNNFASDVIYDDVYSDGTCHSSFFEQCKCDPDETQEDCDACERGVCATHPYGCRCFYCED